MYLLHIFLYITIKSSRYKISLSNNYSEYEKKREVTQSNPQRGEKTDKVAPLCLSKP